MTGFWIGLGIAVAGWWVGLGIEAFGAAIERAIRELNTNID